MLPLFLSYFEEYIRWIHVFQYVTVRAIFAAISSLLIVLFLGPVTIRKLSHYQIGQVVRTDGPDSHSIKAGTPTMGGLLILIAITIATLLWSNLGNYYIWVTICVTAGFGIIGGVDDYKKLIKKNSRGIPAKWKYFWQSACGIIAVLILYNFAEPIETQLLFPFFKNLIIPLGFFYVILSYFVIVGTSNAVNLTDGLDGLAILPIVMIAAALGVFCYLTGHVGFAEYLNFPYIAGVEELVIFCATLIGSGLGFLWFNTYPAQIFMGDVGSLGLGAAIGVIAVIVRQELILFLMGGVFVAETLSVIIQVTSFKLTGRRVFRMAPIHHHFELKGWPESRVIVRFWIITVLLVLLGLSSIKLR